MKSEEYIENVMRTCASDKDAILDRLKEDGIIDMLHAAIGMSTEAAELLDALKKHIYYGKDLDMVNIDEELGDSNWYQSLMIHSMRMKKHNVTWEYLWEKNINKLKARYGDKFTSEAAIKRDLTIERKALEG
jgi:hypothetical protein